MVAVVTLLRKRVAMEMGLSESRDTPGCTVEAQEDGTGVLTLVGNGDGWSAKCGAGEKRWAKVDAGARCAHRGDSQICQGSSVVTF